MRSLGRFEYLLKGDKYQRKFFEEENQPTSEEKPDALPGFGKMTERQSALIPVSYRNGHRSSLSQSSSGPLFKSRIYNRENHSILGTPKTLDLFDEIFQPQAQTIPWRDPVPRQIRVRHLPQIRPNKQNGSGSPLSNAKSMKNGEQQGAFSPERSEELNKNSDKPSIPGWRTTKKKETMADLEEAFKRFDDHTAMEFQHIMDNVSNSLQHIAWNDLGISYSKHEKVVAQLKSAGFAVTFFEDAKSSMLAGFQLNSVFIASFDTIDQLLKVLEGEGQNQKLFGVILLYQKGRQFIKYLKNPMVLAAFDNTGSLYNYILMLSRFFSKILMDKQILNTMGYNFTAYYQNPLYDTKLQMIESDTIDCIQTFFEKNVSIPNIDTDQVKNRFQELKSFLLPSKKKFKSSSAGHPSLIKVLSDEGFVFKMINGVLRNGNWHFYKYVKDIVVKLQSFFSTEDVIDKPLFIGEAYRKMYCNPEFIDVLFKYIDRDKYLFFPGFFCATYDRKLIQSLPGNVFLYIRVEDDPVYRANVLFNLKINGRGPKIIDNFSEFPFKKEVMFPCFYPFKVIGVKMVNGIYEVYLVCPSVYYYNEIDLMALVPDDVNSRKEYYDRKLVMAMSRRSSPIETSCPQLKFETHYGEILCQNLERFQKKLMPLSTFRENNEVILKARAEKKQVLCSEANQRRDFPNILAIIYQLKVEQSINAFETLILTLEVIDVPMKNSGSPTQRSPTGSPSTASNGPQFSIRLFLARLDGTTYLSTSTITELDLLTNLATYEQFFSSIGGLKELHVNFLAYESYKFRELLNLARRMISIVKLIPQYNVLALNMSVNLQGPDLAHLLLNSLRAAPKITVVYLNMDSCGMGDNELLLLTSLTCLPNLEQVTISVQKNKLTSTSITSLLVYLKCRNLKEVEFSLGGNGFDPHTIKTLRDSYVHKSPKIFDQV